MSQYPSLCFAGRLSREKGVDVLLEAFARVLPSVPNARLIVAGDGPGAKISGYENHQVGNRAVC